MLVMSISNRFDILRASSLRIRPLTNAITKLGLNFVELNEMSRSWSSINFLLILLLGLLNFVDSANGNGAACSSCKTLTKTILLGLKNTEKAHFGGGNTAWEEEKLGKYAKSETRLVEIMEYACRKADGIDVDKDEESKCHNYAELYEEQIETWYYHKQAIFPDFTSWLCIENLKLCCPNNTWGPLCEACPGDVERPCFGRGTCNGAGTRTGSGKCQCEAGYQGKVCRRCATNYFSSFQNDTHVTCETCDSSCKGGCKGEGSKNCNDCKDGWKLTPENGCEDVDECLNDICRGPFEECKNTIGSYECSCRSGYKRENGICTVDFSELKNKIDELGKLKDYDGEDDAGDDTEIDPDESKIDLPDEKDEL